MSPRAKAFLLYCTKGLSARDLFLVWFEVGTNTHNTPHALTCCPFQLKNVYKEVLYTVTHKIGGSNSGGGEQVTGSLLPSLHIPQKRNFRLYSDSLSLSKPQNIGGQPQQYNMLKEQLLEYAQAAFGIGRKEHRELMNEVSDEKPPIVVLNVVVIEAKDLEAKDSDGFSDPYCMLGIQPSGGGVDGGNNKHVKVSKASSTPQHSPKKQSLRRKR